MDEGLNTRLHDDFGVVLSSEDKPMSRAQKKNARKKQKRKEKKATELAFEIEEVTDDLEHVSISEPATTKNGSDSTKAISTKSGEGTAIASKTDVDVTKRVRTLRKKLKQIEELEARIASGDIQKPDQDQLSKIAKKQEFLDEISELIGDES